MNKEIIAKSALAAVLVLGMTGCAEMPGTRGQQGAVIGGASGAVVGAAAGGRENRALGTVLGGLLGAAGGYVIGKRTGADPQDVNQASERAVQRPATVQDALASTTADLNKDGFVTLDEIVALRRAGLTEDQMVARLRATGQVYDLNADQEQYLRNQGVSERVLDQLAVMNRGTGLVPTGRQDEIISRPPAR